jgi:hypothetical protein
MSERAPWYTYLPLLVFPFFIFAPIILSGNALFWGTPLTQFIPWWTLAWESILDGKVPLWNDFLGMGAPLLANYQSALIYPPTWLYLLMYMLGGVSTMAWFQAIMVVLHLAWASFGMALLIRQLRLGRLAQVIGGLSFGLSGYLVARAGFMSINAAVAWMPWIVLGATKLAEANILWGNSRGGNSSEKSRRIHTLLSATLLLICYLTLQLLAGHAQSTWYTILLASIWFLYFSVSRPWGAKEADVQEGGENDKNGLELDTQENKNPVFDRIRNVLSQPVSTGILLFGSVLLVAVLLASVQLLPTAEYLLQSQRSAAVDYEFAMNYSFWPWRFLSFLTPDLFGNPAVGDYWGFANYWEDAIYVGLIPFVLAISALVTRGKGVSVKTVVKPKFVYFLLILILFSFIIALGRNTPVFPWLYQFIPTFDMFQAPTRFSIVAVFSLSVLAAIGADSWYRPRDRSLYWLRLGIMAAAAVTIGAGLALLFSRSLTMDIRPSFIRAVALLGIWGIGLGFLTLRAPQKNPNQSQKKWGWWHWAVVIWVGLDLVVAGWGLNPGVDLHVYTEESPTTAEIMSKLGVGRLYLPAKDEDQLKFDRFLRFDTFYPFNEEGEWLDLRAVQLPNVSILDGIPTANNFDPLLPGRYTHWMEKLAEVNLDTRDRMLNLMGVSVVETIDSSGQFGVRFDQREAFPRIRWSSCGKEVESGESALEVITDGTIDFETNVVLENPAQYCSPTGSADLKIMTSDAGRMTLKSFSAEPGYMVIADVWYPGWSAYMDGKSVPLLRANYLFKAVPVPKGEHEVTVVYQPILIYLGAGLSGLTFVTLIILVAVWLGKFRSKMRT